ncbi:MAG: hypothetical protein U0232_13055 [Thermomicrobiales bacterium]
MKDFPGANQGALFVFIDPARFIDPAILKRELDEYHRMVAKLVPFAGTERATLPGRLEWSANGNGRRMVCRSGRATARSWPRSPVNSAWPCRGPSQPVRRCAASLSPCCSMGVKQDEY